MKTTLIASTILLALATLCRAQIPTPTIAATPTPTVTVTPNPASDPYGTPYQYPGTPTPTIPPSTPTPTPIPDQFQPPPTDPQYGTVLEWRPFLPSSGGIDGRWPVVIILHGGGFHSGNYYENVMSAANDLKNAGFCAVVASYPLAPKNLITGQRSHSDPNSGRPPEQTNAVKALVNAARNDSHCYNLEVGILGGSAGASHAAFVALDETDTSGVWPDWNTLKRPNFVAGLSGFFDLAERDDNDDHNINDIENYTHTTAPIEQWNVSPIAKIKASGPTFIPMYFIRSEDETGSPPKE